MLKVVALSMVILAVVLSGCSEGTSYLPTGYNNVPVAAATQAVVKPSDKIGSDNQTPLETVAAKQVVNINDQTFVFPSKICLDSVTAGTVKDIRLQIHNGGDTDALFDVYVQVPTSDSNFQILDKHTPSLIGTYGAASPLVSSLWTTFPQGQQIPIQAKWTEDIHVKLDIPLGVILAPKWYFYIVVKDHNQDVLQYAVGSTIFVNSQ
jgi:hypothetical protein